MAYYYDAAIESDEFKRLSSKARAYVIYEREHLIDGSRMLDPDPDIEEEVAEFERKFER